MTAIYPCAWLGVLIFHPYSAGIAYTDEMDAQIRKPVEAGFEKEGHPYYASARLWDDG